MRESVKQLESRARELRKIALEMAYVSGTEGAHIGPAFSLMDIMTVLFFDTMNYRVEEPDWPDRDRLILSKGHACLGLYAPLVMSGYLSKQQADSFNQPHTHIAGHPSGKGVHGIEHPAGSLGHGLSVACGMAKGAKLTGRPYNTYAVIGDGESNEGSIWEAVMFAAQHKLDNLVAVVDANGFQYGGPSAELMNMEPLDQKWRAFGWNVIEVNGHDLDELDCALDAAWKAEGKPTLILANTVKGKGVDFMENNVVYHYASGDSALCEKAKASIMRG